MEKVINNFDGITYRSYVISSPADDIGELQPTDFPCVPYGDKFNIIYEALNTAKRYMDSIPEKKLMLLRKILYPFHGIPRRLPIKYVTNAWLKTYEMLLVENIVQKTTKFVVFFNANAPGTSSMAFEYFMGLHHNNIEYDWVASSLIGKGALTDTFGIIQNTKDKWLMDDTNNGDVTDIKNILDFVEKIQKRFRRGVDLYFSDIGKETKDYDHEEHNEIKEVYAQNIIALMTMRRGGTMITKQRNFMTPFNMSMISFFATLFSEFKIVKPETSRQLNSEIYLIGKNFLGITDLIKNKIFYILENYGVDGTPMSIPFGISVRASKDMLIAARGIISTDQISALNLMEDLNKKNNLQTVFTQVQPYIISAEDSLIQRLKLK